MRIHPVISVAQLEPAASNTSQDPYARKINAESPPVRNESDKYQVERVLGKRKMWNKTHYLIKWADWGNEHNVWYAIDDLDHCQDLIQEYEARRAMHPLAGRNEEAHSDRSERRVSQQVQPKPASTAPTSQALIPTKPTTKQDASIQPTKRGRGRPRKAA